MQIQVYTFEAGNGGSGPYFIELFERYTSFKYMPPRQASRGWQGTAVKLYACADQAYAPKLAKKSAGKVVGLLDLGHTRL